MERKLPIIEIEGTEFTVDANRLRLFEKADPKNIIELADMNAVADGYIFDYSPNNKNLPYTYDRNYTTVKIPEFVVLDPDAMAVKYGFTINEVKRKSDFELMVNQNAFDLRVNKGILPTINVAGHVFYVDIRMDMLRPKDDFLSKGIKFSDIENYYDEHHRSYTIPYNPKTHEFQEPEYQSIKEFPKHLIAVKFLSERLLDRIGWNRKYGFDIKHGLLKQGLKLSFTANEVPWKETFLSDLIKSNRKTIVSTTESEQQKNSKSRRI